MLWLLNSSFLKGLLTESLHMWDVFHFVSLNLISSAVSFHFSWMLVKEPRKNSWSSWPIYFLLCASCAWNFSANGNHTMSQPSRPWRTWRGDRSGPQGDGPMAMTVSCMALTTRCHPWLNTTHSLVSDSKPILLKTLIHMTQVALLGSRFATQKEMKWHCKLHSSSDKNADTSCSQSGNQCTQKQAHNKFTWRFFIIWWHVLCSKTASRFTLSTEGLVHNPTLHCETSHGWKFFWTWRLGQRASVLVAGYTCPAFSGKACWNGCYPSHSSIGLWSKGVGCKLHTPNPNRSREKPWIFYKPKSFASCFLGPASAAQDLSYHCQKLHFHSRLCPFQAVFDDKLTTKHISQAALLIKSTMRGIATSISDKHLWRFMRDNNVLVAHTGNTPGIW